MYVDSKTTVKLKHRASVFFQRVYIQLSQSINQSIKKNNNNKKAFETIPGPGEGFDRGKTFRYLLSPLPIISPSKMEY